MHDVAERLGRAAERKQMKEELVQARKIAEDNYNKLRELENLIEGIIAVSPNQKKTITDKDLKNHLVWQQPKTSEHQVLALDKLEKFALEEALRESKGNKSRAAEMLGISRDTLYRKLKIFDIK